MGKNIIVKWVDRTKWIRLRLSGASEQAADAMSHVDPRELLSIGLGFALALALIAKGDLETGKTIALALIFFGIGRSVP